MKPPLAVDVSMSSVTETRSMPKLLRVAVAPGGVGHAATEASEAVDGNGVEPLGASVGHHALELGTDDSLATGTVEVDVPTSDVVVLVGGPRFDLLALQVGGEEGFAGAAADLRDANVTGGAATSARGRGFCYGCH